MFPKGERKYNAPILKDTPWSFFATSEGFLKTLQMSMFKIIGSFFSLPFFFFTTFIIGLIQIIGGLIINLRSRYEVFPRKKYIFGSILLGFIAVYTAIVPMYIFSISQADIALIAFIVSLILIPKSLFDKFIFRDSISSKQLISIPLFIFGLYALVGFPSLSEIKNMPLWAMLALTLPIAILIEEFITKSFKVGVVSPWVNNFWIGFSTVLVSIIIFLFVNPFSLAIEMLNSSSLIYWTIIFVLGFSFLAQIFAKQRTYMHGGSISSKKIVMISTYLISSLIVGALFFTESISFGEVVGIIALIAGYLFVEQGSFHQLLSFLTRKNLIHEE
jgi:drug/metabolite transporter (DMT)-like permease